MYYAFDRRWLNSTVTVALVLLNIATYLACLVFGDAIYEAGELDVAKVVFGGEYNRLFSAMFLHAGLGHLFSNMVLLFYLGATMERGIGHLSFALLYLGSGAIGNLLTVRYEALRGEIWSSVGASGAVFGVMGAMIALLLRTPKEIRRGSTLLPRIGFMALYSLYAGMSSRGINNVAHVGGLIAGALIAFAMTLTGKKIDLRALL